MGSSGTFVLNDILQQQIEPIDGRGCRVARRYPNAHVVFVGRDEADFVIQIFERLGLTRDRIIVERKSRNIAENAGVVAGHAEVFPMINIELPAMKIDRIAWIGVLATFAIVILFAARDLSFAFKLSRCGLGPARDCAHPSQRCRRARTPIS